MDGLNENIKIYIENLQELLEDDGNIFSKVGKLKDIGKRISKEKAFIYKSQGMSNKLSWQDEIIKNHKEQTGFFKKDNKL